MCSSSASASSSSFAGSLHPIPPLPSTPHRCPSFISSSSIIPFKWSPSATFINAGPNLCLFPEDILTIRMASSGIDALPSSADHPLLLLSACPFIDSFHRQFRRFHLRSDDPALINALYAALAQWLLQHRPAFVTPPHHPLTDCSRRALVLLNPFSGQRRASELWAHEVEPLWREAGIVYEVRLTEGPEHATRIAAQLDLDRVGILAVGGGDGIVCEAINGLFSRAADRQRALRLPLVHLPMGTGNSLAASIAFQANEPFPPRGTFCRQMAMMTVHQSCYRRLRLYRAEFAKGLSRMMFLSLSWGLMADIDLGSERFRFLGLARFHLEAFIRIARLPSVARYRARLSYLPMSDGPARRELERKVRFGVKEQRTAFGETHFSGGEVREEEGQNDQNDDQEDGGGGLREDEMPSSLTDPVPSNWQSIEGEFCFVLLSALSHIGSDLPIVPSARPQDPVLYLSFVRWRNLRSRVHMANILLNINSCGHLADSAYEIIPVLACRIQPAPGMAGFIALDGEAVQNEPGQAFQVVATPWCATVVGMREKSKREHSE